MEAAPVTPPAAPTPEAKPVEAAAGTEQPRLVLETSVNYDSWLPSGPRHEDNPWEVPPGNVAPLGPAPGGEAPKARPPEDPHRVPRLLSSASLPFLSHDINTLYRGWPLILELALHQDYHQLYAEHPVLTRVEAQSGNWHSFIKLAVYSTKKVQLVAVSSRKPFRPQELVPPLEPEAWPFRLVDDGPAPGPIGLEAMEGERLRLVLTPQQTARLEPGEYEVKLWLDTRSGATDDSYQGVLYQSIPLSVRDPPASLSEETACEKARIDASYFDLLQDNARAGAALEDFLRRFPKSKEFTCWGERGKRFEAAGQYAEAVKLYGHARSVWRERYPHSQGQPPYEETCSALLRKLRGRPPRQYHELLCEWPP